VARLLLVNAAKHALTIVQGLLTGISKEDFDMLWTLFVILLVLWLLGMVSAYTLGGFIHILLVVAVIILLFRLFSGRTVV
jgi:hypothetical protein